MNFATSYSIKRNNKKIVKVTLECTNGSYHADIDATGLDLRNSSHKFLLASDAVQALNEKGFCIYADFN